MTQGPIGREGDSLVYVVWEVTLRCDLACEHCGSRAGRPRREELSTAEALDLVAQLAGLGAKEVTLIGGEAYLRDDWPTLVRAIRDAGMRCTMTTGGRGMTPARAALGAGAGLQAASVSVDGIGATHDAQRALRGSFDAAVAAVRNLRGAGVPTALNTQINRLTFGELDRVLDLAIAEGCHAWQFQLTVAMGRAADRAAWLLQPYDLLAVIPKVAELTERARAHGVRMWPANNIGYFGPHEATIRGPMRPGAHAGGCHAGRHALGVESDGAIKGCPSLPSAEYTGGNIRERTLRDLWDHAQALHFTRTRTVDELWGYCRSCYYADTCRAGCTWTGHSLLGRRGNNPMCHHRALELQRVGLRERLVQVADAPGLPFDHGRFEVVTEPFTSTEGPAPLWEVLGRPIPLDAAVPPEAPGDPPRRRLPVVA
jgi:radical SAM protein with 4Fe4S-binding SPASM domain